MFSSLARDQKSLTVLSGLSVLFCIAAFWYVASTPEVPVRCVLSDGVAADQGLELCSGPTPNQYKGALLPVAGDSLLAVGGRPIYSFVDYVRAQAELRNRTVMPGGRLWVGQSPEDLTPDSMHTFVELEDGTHFVRIEFRQPGNQTIQSGWLRLTSQPLGPLSWSFVWFLLQLPIVVLTGLAYWRRPDDRAVKLFFVVGSLSLVAYTGGNHWWVIAGTPTLVVPFLICSALLPAVLLHFFLVYPAPSRVILNRPVLSLIGLYLLPIAWSVGGVSCITGASLLSLDWGDGPLVRELERWFGGGSAGLLDLLRTGIFFYLTIAALYFLLSVVCLIRSYLSVRNPMERSQVRWILRAGVLASAPICYTLWLAYHETANFAYGAARGPMFLASALFMVAYAVGIARYKLMLVDQALTRGMWYYVISTALTCGASLIIAAGAVSTIHYEHSLFNHPLPLTFVLSTSILAMSWLRDRFQQSVDRKFFREKYPLDKALQRINRAVTHVLERQAVADHLLSSCCEALRVERAALYLQNGPRSYRLATVIGRMAVPLQFSGDDLVLDSLIEETAVQRVPSGVSPVQNWLRKFGAELLQGLESDGEIVGIVALGQKANGAAYTAEDVTFIAAIGRVTGVALHCAKIHEDIGRLNEDLQQKSQLIGEQTRRITVLQQELARVSAPAIEFEKTEFRREAIKGHSPAIQGVLDTVRKVAASDSSVLLRGESGTGKELLARAIHENSPRREGPLVSVHCASLSPTLLESELFGHVRGAFTDAREARIGRFQLAEGGTLFLDEIGDISLDTQVKLLRVLQERMVEPVGGAQPVPVDVRLVAATHQNLEQLISTGQFREDLYYRLNVISITMPPLRERREDLFELSLHFLRRACERTGKQVSAIDDAALRLLAEHAWPGNIRELQNVIERAVVLAEGSVVTVDDLPEEVRDMPLLTVARRVPAPSERPVRRTLTSDVLAAPRRISVAGSTDERHQLEEALRQCNGNKADAARMLGMPRSTLFSKLKKHRLD